MKLIINIYHSSLDEVMSNILTLAKDCYLKPQVSRLDQSPFQHGKHSWATVAHELGPPHKKALFGILHELEVEGTWDLLRSKSV